MELVDITKEIFQNRKTRVTVNFVVGMKIVKNTEYRHFMMIPAMNGRRRNDDCG